MAERVRQICDSLFVNVDTALELGNDARCSDQVCEGPELRGGWEPTASLGIVYGRPVCTLATGDSAS